MAYSEVLQSITLNADSSIGIYTGVPGALGSPANPGGLQYRAVKVNGEHQAALVTAATDIVVGVLQNKPQSTGAAATVGINGITKVECGGAIAAGAQVGIDTSGRAVTYASGTVLGYAIHSTANSGELATVLLRLR